ncbi:MAG: hypothetical protein P1U47_16550 [Zhongshania sp.]|uniref:hypothetical protein n=1 Tax=Zhongshania sp. TaxID=1971902 RepID=UPI002634F991|nr:hypothetical protein [Zhongshania sp.]MDF1693986.1 hypothetical protein [Zhongshania sp.]
MAAIIRSSWAEDFPDVVVDCDLAAATGHSQYVAAKGGSMQAALEIADAIISDEAVGALKGLLNGRPAVLVPVYGIEASGANKLPLAAAVVLAARLGIQWEETIIQVTKVGRTGQDGWYRLANAPAFEGSLPDGTLTVLVDDTLTQGGTFASLKGHVEEFGRVIGIYALTGKQYSRQLRLSEETLIKLRDKYGEIEEWWESQFEYDFAKLTEWEARYILHSKRTADEVRDRVIKARQKRVDAMGG